MTFAFRLLWIALIQVINVLVFYKPVTLGPLLRKVINTVGFLRR